MLLVRLAGGEKHPDTDGWFAGFRDVPDWARTAVNYAARRGWISGVSNVQFNPERSPERRRLVCYAAADAGLQRQDRGL